MARREYYASYAVRGYITRLGYRRQADTVGGIDSDTPHVSHDLHESVGTIQSGAVTIALVIEEDP